MKEVNLPDGTVGEFPDDMDDAAIEAVLSKQFGKAPSKASEFYDTAAGIPMQFLGGAKHAWDRAAAGLESMIPGGQRLSKALGQPDLQQLKESGKQFVKETGPASSLGEFAGEVGLTAVPGTAAFNAVNRVSRAAPVLNRTIRYLGGGAAAGGAGAATMGDDVGTGAMIGGVTGPLMPAIATPLNAASRLYQRFVAPPASQAASHLQQMFGNRTQDIINKLRATRGIVPGELPTAGDAAVLGTIVPELKVLEQGARSRNLAGDFANRDRANELARRRVVEQMAAPGQRETVGGTLMPSPAQALRQQVTTPLYQRAGPDQVPVSQQLADQLAGPEAAAASRRGTMSFEQGIANETAGPRGLPGYTPPGPDFMGRIPDAPFMPQLPTRSIDDLQRAKNALTRDINALGEGGETGLRRQQLMDVRRELNDAMRQSGNYRVASDIFGNYSRPIDQAEVGRVLSEALRKPGTAGERLGAFSTAMENAPRTLKKATGDPRYQQLEQVMTPNQVGELRALERSVGRQAEYAALPSSQGIVPEFLSAADEIERATPGVFSQIITIARSGLKRLGNASDDRVREVVDRAMLDPNAFADLISQLPPEQRSNILNMMRQNLPRVQGAVSGYAGQTGE